MAYRKDHYSHFSYGEIVYMNFFKRKVSIKTRIRKVNKNYPYEVRYKVDLMDKWYGGFTSKRITKKPLFKIGTEKDVIIREEVDTLID